METDSLLWSIALFAILLSIVLILIFCFKPGNLVYDCDGIIDDVDQFKEGRIVVNRLYKQRITAIKSVAHYAGLREDVFDEVPDIEPGDRVRLYVDSKNGKLFWDLDPEQMECAT